jgi:hypothetical protein
MCFYWDENLMEKWCQIKLLHYLEYKDEIVVKKLLLLKPIINEAIKVKTLYMSLLKNS